VSGSDCWLCVLLVWSWYIVVSSSSGSQWCCAGCFAGWQEN